MSYADQVFVETCKAILESPFSDEGQNVRPHWEDGTPAHTRKIFGVCNTYDLQKEFPIMTLRRVYWRTALQEILWIYQKKSNVIAELGSHIWDSWNVGDGTIGKAYGYQIGQKTRYKEGEMDQMERVFFDLKHNPMSRSIITTTYCMKDLPQMGLRPCAYSMTYNVTRDERTGTMYLNGLLNQRSQDMLTANNWNTVQYALLLCLVAKEVGMRPGKLVHVIADCHIYDRHVPYVKDMIEAYEFGECMAAPTLDDIYVEPKCFDALTPKDVEITNYLWRETDYQIEVAI